MNEDIKSDLNKEAICVTQYSGPEVIIGPSPKIEVRKSIIHGYGVFAKVDIEQGEMVEQSKLLKLGWRGNYINDPVLRDYIWANKACQCEQCRGHGFFHYIALGFGSLYNHSATPNTKQEFNFRAEVMTVKAGEKIRKDDELFLNYGHKYWLVRDFWKQVNKDNTLQKFVNNKKDQ